MFSLITNSKVTQPSISSNKIFDEPYKDGLGELVGYYASVNGIIDIILKFQSIRSVVEGYYQVLVNYKEISEINTLSEKYKTRIWKMTEGLEMLERVKASKAIYLMEVILENTH